ncbi:unnamed protein product, partial [marine sediment metagenome]
CGREIRRTPQYCPSCRSPINEEKVEWTEDKPNHFKCTSCSIEIEAEEEHAKLPGVKCPYCSFRILSKKRPAITRKVKAQ